VWTGFLGLINRCTGFLGLGNGCSEFPALLNGCNGFLVVVSEWTGPLFGILRRHIKYYGYVSSFKGR
jgi:hypothetical protein